MKIFKNKKGQVASIILAVVTIFIIGMIVFFANHVNEKLYGELDEYFNESEDYKDTEAHNTTRDIRSLEQGQMWDYAVLAIYIGIIIQMILLSFASRQNVAFFWIFVIISLVILILGTILSNIWQEVVSNPEFSETIKRFPITDTLLGSYFPTVVTGLIFFAIIILFGKFPGGSRDE